MSLRAYSGLLGLVAVCGLATAQSPPIDEAAEFVRAHCIECHGGDSVKGKLDLTQSTGDAVAEAWRWSRLRERVRVGEMPPPDAEQPQRSHSLAFVQAVDARLRHDVPRLPADPGRVTVRRLSRGQWENCVRDLCGVQARTVAFPADDLGYGFDSIGDALTFSTLHLEHYLSAAGAVAAAVFDGEDPLHPTRRRFAAGSMRVVANPGAVRVSDASLHMLSRATVHQDVTLPRAGVYALRLFAGADQAGDEPAKMLLRLDGRDLGTFDVEQKALRSYELKAPLLGGEHRFEITFLNDHYAPTDPDPERRDRNLHVDWFEVEGPLDARVVPPQQQWLHEAIARIPDERKRLQALAKVVLPRVWRRPVGEDEVLRVVRAAAQELEDSGSIVRAQRLVLQAALVSPHFLFRLEAGGHEGGAGRAVPLNGPALASRLSFLVWASTPDARLLQLARDGKLTDVRVLIAELDRLLADERADALATDFAAQWLELRNLAERTPDPARFPGFDDGLRRSLRRETELLFRAVLREGRDVRELLDADFTHVDARLAAVYGMPSVAGDDFVRVPLLGEARDRGGVLGHASVLAVTSNPTRTSPVKRGKWILENLLGQPPPPPPPGNDSLANEAAIDSARSFREQLAQHRQRAACAVCHVRMDALGFALEQFDVVGRLRRRDAGGDIDCSGELPDGTKLQGLGDLKRVLVADPAFVRTLTHKLFVYGVGRELRPVDRLRLDLRVDELLATGKVTVRDLLLAVVRDVAFTSRIVAAAK